MKKYFTWFLLLMLVSCKEKKKESTDLQKEIDVVTRSINLEFQKILDEADVKGAILIYDFQNKNYHSNDFSWAKTGKLPASTYKIPNSIIALETGVVHDLNTIFPWNGERRFLKSWEEDLTFTQAFQRSCVPCYQEIARKIGVERMNEYLGKFQYGNIQVDSTTIDSFWLQGNARIDQFQQIDFLARFFQSKLPISKRTEAIVKEMMILKQTENYVLRGKTGWSIVDDLHNGWFVGYVENGTEVFFFATNVAPISTTFDEKKFQECRKEVTYKALKQLNVLL